MGGENVKNAEIVPAEAKLKWHQSKWVRVAMWGFVVVYFLSPFDVLPEAIFGPLGYADDSLLVILKII